MKRLIALAAVLILAGCGSTKFVTTTTTHTATLELTTTTTNTVTHTQVRRSSSLPPVTVTQTAATQTAAPVASAPSSSNGRKFSGNGSESLGTLHISTNSTVHWTNDGGLFELSDAGYGIAINSTGRSGVSAVPAGTYTSVQVGAIGNWTIQITPG